MAKHAEIKPGIKFNKWTLIEFKKDDKGKKLGWICRCECGIEKLIYNISTVVNGSSTSCGCVRKDLLSKNNPMYSKEIRDKVSNSHKISDKSKSAIKKAQVAAQKEDVCVKRIKTNMDRYGGTTPACSSEVRAKMKITNEIRYGGSAPIFDPVVAQKMRNTLLKEYGVDNIMKLDEYKKLVSKKVSEFRRGKGVEKLPNGQIVIDECRRLGVLSTTYRNWRREGGEDFAQSKLYAEKIEWRSLLEKKALDILHNELDKFGVTVEGWNKKAREDIKYKPDIKLTYKDVTIFVDIDGLYWHSVDDDEDDYKSYHIDKAAEFNEKGIVLLQFRENEIRDKSEIVVSMIKHRLKLSSKNFGARQLFVNNVKHGNAEIFMNNNHLMGTINGVSSIGLFNGTELIALLSYRKNKNNEIDISRYCVKKGHSVAGGFNKLLSYLENNEKPHTIYSFVDLRYHSGTSYISCGFKLESIHLGFQWTDKYKVFNRMHCKADNDRGMTEKDVAKEMDLRKIYDAGQAKFIKTVIGK